MKLIEEAFRKQTELRKNDYWSRQIPERCPPVLWFGDPNKDKIITTVGLNPSYGEFFDSQADAENLQYLPQPLQRFHVLNEEDQRNPTSSAVIDKVRRSYESYFKQNPYTRWFGKTDGYNVEFFLNRWNASYYGAKTIGAVHVDLFPFVTVDKFSDIDRRRWDEDVFSDPWYREQLKALLQFLNPRQLIVFGRRTVDIFNEQFNGGIELDRDYLVESRRYASYGVGEYPVGGKFIPVIGLSVNLGNPRGFDKRRLAELGSLSVKLVASLNDGKRALPLSLPLDNALLDIALRHEGNRPIASLGDAVLRLVVRQHYYDNGSDAEKMQCMESKYASNEFLGKLGKDHKLRDYIRTSSGPIPDSSVEAYARAVEALIGASYIEHGLPATRRRIEEVIAFE